jgi:hypothetical protein
MIHEGMRGPIPLAAADADHEVVQELQTVRGVIDLRMELHREGHMVAQAISGHRHILGTGDHIHGLAGRGDAVPMAHPHLGACLDTVEEVAVADGIEVRTSVFPHRAAFHGSTCPFGQQLRTITHTQHRHLADDPGEVGVRRVGFVDTARTTTQNDPSDRGIAHELLGLGKGMDLAIHIEFAYPTGDELGILGTVIENEDGTWHGEGPMERAPGCRKSSRMGLRRTTTSPIVDGSWKRRWVRGCAERALPSS